MKIVIHNTTFPFNEGCRLLKLQHKTCPYPQLEDFWADIKPMTFAEIATLPNLEHRRVGVLCMGLERLAEEVQPTLINSETIRKTTTWVMQDGSTKTVEFDDTYELYRVDGKHFNEGVQGRWNETKDCYFIKCKDTSTDRNYFIWVDLWEVYRNNHPANTFGWYSEDLKAAEQKVTAIEAIAWTIQTNVNMANIEKIIRQGDCILIKPYDTNGTGSVRHLTEDEYRTLLVAES
jgi:hypothetical protein